LKKLTTHLITVLFGKAISELQVVKLYKESFCWYFCGKWLAVKLCSKHLVWGGGLYPLSVSE